MEAKAYQHPTINLNVLIQNYINVYTSKEDASTFSAHSEPGYRNDTFPKEFAKKSEAPYSAKLYPSLQLSSQETTPTNRGLDSLRVFSSDITKKQSEIYEERENLSENSHHLTEIVGFFLLGFGAILFMAVFYALIISPLIGETGHILLDFIKEDSYYCMLIPLLIPVTLAVGYANWVSIKFFRHT